MMDVDKTSFYPLLLDILSDIAEAHVVCIDLELSGVPSKDSWQKPSRSRKPTLQERYLEIKDAAERYQILQIGLTCVEQNVQDGKYILKPYNFYLNPVIPERLDVERIFSFQSGAVEFLLKAGFDMNLPFTIGIPYLSRAESNTARAKFAKRQDRTAVAEIHIKPTETESLAFLDRVRGEINGWVALMSGPDTPNHITITPSSYETADAGQPTLEELSKYEKRLVHQLVRAEYPELVTITRKGFVQIVRFDKEREERIAAERKQDLEQRIGRQKGFRWIIEALLGNNISSLDLHQCARDSVTGDSIFADMDDYKAQFNRAQAHLRGNPKVVVGHNCFLDMVYLYRTFIGELPPTVEEFQGKLHKLLPIVVDTKYMSTHNCGDINPVSSLEQIAHQLSMQEKPVLETDARHTKYSNSEVLHEAGYDSYLTAQIAVRLSAKLEREGTNVDFEKHDSQSPSSITNGASRVKLDQQTSDLHIHEDKIKGQVTCCADTQPFTPSEIGGKWKRVGDPTLEPPRQGELFTYNPRDLKHRHHSLDLTIPDGMPRLKSDFWRVYGNKLRVFGTEEGVCVLDDSLESPVSDEGGVNV